MPTEVLVFIGAAATGKSYLAQSKKYQQFDHWCPGRADGQLWEAINIPPTRNTIISANSFSEIPTSFVPHVTAYYCFRGGMAPGFNADTSQLIQGQFLVHPGAAATSTGG